MTDELLAEKAKLGDEEAMNTLLTKYKGLVNKISRSYFLMGGDMEDTVQEGMIGLYKAIISFQPDKNAKFKTFAFSCIKHQIQNAVKKASSEKNMILTRAFSLFEQTNDEDEDSRIELILPSDLPQPDDELIAAENLKEFQEKMQKSLSAMELKVLNLYLKGYNYSEISQEGNIPKKSIDNALSRIKNKLSFLKKAE